MTRKPILVTIFFLIIATATYSQHFLQSVGVSGSVMRATLKGPLGKTGRFGMTFIQANYFPRISLPVNDFTAISVGIPFGIGAGLIDNQFLAVKGTYLSYDIPLVVDYNFGYKAAEPGDDHLGFYFGFGGGYTGTKRDTLGVTGYKANSFGVLARAGVRIDFEIPDKTTGLSIGLFHKIGMGEEKFKTSGVNILIDF